MIDCMSWTYKGISLLLLSLNLESSSGRQQKPGKYLHFEDWILKLMLLVNQSSASGQCCWMHSGSCTQLPQVLTKEGSRKPSWKLNCTVPLATLLAAQHLHTMCVQCCYLEPEELKIIKDSLNMPISL